MKKFFPCLMILLGFTLLFIDLADFIMGNYPTYIDPGFNYLMVAVFFLKGFSDLGWVKIGKTKEKQRSIWP